MPNVENKSASRSSPALKEARRLLRSLSDILRATIRWSDSVFMSGGGYFSRNLIAELGSMEAMASRRIPVFDRRETDAL